MGGNCVVEAYYISVVDYIHPANLLMSLDWHAEGFEKKTVLSDMSGHRCRAIIVRPQTSQCLGLTGRCG